MIETLQQLEKSLNEIRSFCDATSDTVMESKISDKKWSKKEILGHLIDSGINNLKRFAEIQFESKPYRIQKYNQNELVKANDYQHSETKELLNILLALNTRIIHVIKLQTNESLAYKIDIDSQTSDLRFLIQDYVDHFEYHIKQITAA